MKEPAERIGRLFAVFCLTAIRFLEVVGKADRRHRHDVTAVRGEPGQPKIRGLKDHSAILNPQVPAGTQLIGNSAAEQRGRGGGLLGVVTGRLDSNWSKEQ